MLIASVVPSVEAAGLDQQLAGVVARPNRQAAVARAEDAADRSQSPQVLHGEADRAALGVHTPNSGWEGVLGRAGGDVVDSGCPAVLLSCATWGATPASGVVSMYLIS